MSIFSFVYFPVWILGQRSGSDCINSLSLICLVLEDITLLHWVSQV